MDMSGVGRHNGTGATITVPSMAFSVAVADRNESEAMTTRSSSRSPATPRPIGKAEARRRTVDAGGVVALTVRAGESAVGDGTSLRIFERCIGKAG